MAATGGRVGASGTAATSRRRADSRNGRAPSALDHPAEADQTRQIERGAATEQRGREQTEVPGAFGMHDDAFSADGGEHDPGDDGKVPVPVGVRGHLNPITAVSAAQRVFGDRGRDVEVEPPQGDRVGDAEHAGHHQRDACRSLGCPQPKGEQGLADRENDDDPWRSAMYPALWMRQAPSRRVTT
jgi:hypothetical protein